MTDDHPEGNAQVNMWDTAGAPPMQAAVIRLARPMLLWALGVVTMGLGALTVGAIEAMFPGRGIGMARAMAALLRAYPSELYMLVAFLFSGQAAVSIIDAWKGRGR